MTVSSRLSGPPGASCATVPMRAFCGTLAEPDFGDQIAENELQKRGFAGAIAPHKAHLVAVGQGGRGLLEQEPSADSKGEIVDL